MTIHVYLLAFKHKEDNQFTFYVWYIWTTQCLIFQLILKMNEVPLKQIYYLSPQLWPSNFKIIAFSVEQCSSIAYVCLEIPRKERLVKCESIFFLQILVS